MQHTFIGLFSWITAMTIKITEESNTKTTFTFIRQQNIRLICIKYNILGRYSIRFAETKQIMIFLRKVLRVHLY
jgi:hypothetical protein